jgi:DNA helicase IV
MVVSVQSTEEAMAKALTLVNVWVEQDGVDGTANTCVIASSGRVRDAVAKHFQNNGVQVAVIDESQNAGASQAKTYFATMHRAKGLEFDRVIVLAPKAYMGDPLETGSKRKLIYVALTRAKKEAALLMV